ncbi:hypothetical protein BDZ91DRAFT_763706 [Kalaharituber pfeilii]|nr:hypothetical protein BDZ91DRAFT_763706 [Kalaharituber pfeilii]
MGIPGHTYTLHKYHLLPSVAATTRSAPSKQSRGPLRRDSARGGEMERKLVDSCYRELRLVVMEECCWRIDSVVSIEAKKPIWGRGAGLMDLGIEGNPGMEAEEFEELAHGKIEHVRTPEERDEEFIRRELDGTVPKRMTRVKLEDVVEFDIIREVIYTSIFYSLAEKYLEVAQLRNVRRQEAISLSWRPVLRLANVHAQSGTYQCHEKWWHAVRWWEIIVQGNVHMEARLGPEKQPAGGDA